jgi:hypothetical protein
MDLVPERAPGFEERFTALAAISYRVGYRRVGDRAEAEDLGSPTRSPTSGASRSSGSWPSPPWPARPTQGRGLWPRTGWPASLPTTWRSTRR